MIIVVCELCLYSGIYGSVVVCICIVLAVEVDSFSSSVAI